jgi:hypothetical protein
LIPFPGSTQKQHELTVKFREVDAYGLAEFELVQTPTQIPSGAKVITILNGAKSPLYCATKRAIQPIKPVNVRNSTFAGFIRF